MVRAAFIVTIILIDLELKVIKWPNVDCGFGKHTTVLCENAVLIT